MKIIFSDPVIETDPAHIIKVSENALSDGERNRLVIEHTGLVKPIVAGYRGRKGIPFEELTAQGMLGLVEASRRWQPDHAPQTKFITYATQGIHFSIFNFIESWEEHVGLREFGETDRDWYDWDVWAFAAPYETWKHLVATPEELVCAFEQLTASSLSLKTAMQFLGKRERGMIEARFLRNPAMTFQDIARDHKVSYSRTVFLINRALKQLREHVKLGGRRLPRPRPPQTTANAGAVPVANIQAGISEEAELNKASK